MKPNVSRVFSVNNHTDILPAPYLVTGTPKNRSVVIKKTGKAEPGRSLSNEWKKSHPRLIDNA